MLITSEIINSAELFLNQTTTNMNNTRMNTWTAVVNQIASEMEFLLEGCPLKYRFLRNAPQINFWLTLDDTKPVSRRNIWFIDLNLAVPRWLRDSEREMETAQKRREMEESGLVNELSAEKFEEKLQCAVSKQMGKRFGRSSNRLSCEDEQNLHFILCYGLESDYNNDANQKNVRRYIYHALKNNPHAAVAHEGKGNKHVTRWIAQNAITWENTPALPSGTEVPQAVTEALLAEIREMIRSMVQAVNALRKHMDDHGTLLDSADEEIKDSVASSLSSILGMQELESRAHRYWPTLADASAIYPGESASFQALYMALPAARREAFCRAIVFDQPE